MPKSTTKYYGSRQTSIEDPTQDDAMQALVNRLMQIQSTPSVQIWDPMATTGSWAINYLLLELDTLIRFLRDKREQVEILVEQANTTDSTVSRWRMSFEEEKKHKTLLYAKKEWRDIQRKAVRLGVADLIVNFLPPKEHISGLKAVLSMRASSDPSEIRNSFIQRPPEASNPVQVHTALPPPPLPLTLGKPTSSSSEAMEGDNSPVTNLQQTIMELKLLEVVYEFIAGGYYPAQNAMYDAIADHQDRFVIFLMKHLEQRDRACFVLLVLQQLCENHHSQWQGLMRTNDTSFLSIVSRLMQDVYWRDVPISLNDTSILLAITTFFTEACQGPCEENQEYLSSSNATTLCCDLALGSVLFEPDVPIEAKKDIQRCASECLLALMEGRTDDKVSNHLATFLTAERVLSRIVSNYRALDDMDTDEDAINSLEFADSIDLLQVVFRMTNSNLSTALDPMSSSKGLTLSAVNRFSLEWDELKLKWKAQEAIQYFQLRMISVEISRLGATFCVYFLKPKTAKYFDRGIRRRFLDSMDLGSEDALHVLISESARDIEEELKVTHWLEQNSIYALLGNWNWRLREFMLYLVCYINFVLILTLKYPSTSSDESVSAVATKTETMHSLITCLGVILLLLATLLWCFHAVQTLCFNYMKQQVRLDKLTLCPPKTIRERTLAAFGHVVFLFRKLYHHTMPSNICLELFLSTFSIVIFLYSTDDQATRTLGALAVLELCRSLFSAFRTVCSYQRFLVTNASTYRDMQQLDNIVRSNIYFWYSVLYDTLFSGTVLVFGFYSLCALLALQPFSWAYLFYGFPLVDILETNSRLNFVATAMRTNLGKLGVTAVFGAISIYIFSLIGFFLLQDEMTSDDTAHCSSLLECFSTYIRYGLLSGGGIGDYISSDLNHELDYNQPKRYFERLVYDMAFYVVVITLFLNMIQGIIIDAFTSVREAAEMKVTLKRERCLVCNRARSAIEVAGMEKGMLNNFARHTEIEHNLFNYFFYIQYVNGKDDKDRNGIESYVFEKLKTKDMSWIPRV
ncbi:type I inositol triphosphate receptor [Thraustotheca clavata]|uniref:Type I inositol triphosphate receptor n=1 Tax=Thraustotheca clavata TaxID=74557 RepID=A0A1W0A619_9STRA|nr:type I inositol triphosphate receptor [Thraustotheca clavata]